EPGEKAHTCVLAGKTCMTGDVIGEYTFDAPLKIGDRIILTDMLQYTMVKNTTFNGMPPPDIAILRKDGRYEVMQTYGYEDFRRKLGGPKKSGSEKAQK